MPMLALNRRSHALVRALRPRRHDLRLLDAVKRRDPKAVTALLQLRSDVNAAQPDGATALGLGRLSG